LTKDYWLANDFVDRSWIRALADGKLATAHFFACERGADPLPILLISVGTFGNPLASTLTVRQFGASSVTIETRKSFNAAVTRSISGLLSPPEKLRTICITRPASTSTALLLVFDTLTVLDGANAQHKIRLAGIDAPEKARLPIDDLGDTMGVAEVVQPDNSGHDFVRRVNSILFWARAVVFLE